MRCHRMGPPTAESRLKHAVITLAMNAAVLSSANPEEALAIFDEILVEIRRVKYHRPIIPKPSQPRVSKHPKNKWRTAKLSEIEQY